MTTYSINYEGGILKIGFGEPAQNDQIVKDAKAAAESIKNDLMGLELLKISGPASLPVAMLLAHEFSHVVGAVACFDPKLKHPDDETPKGAFVVCISHNASFKVGDLIQVGGTHDR